MIGREKEVDILRRCYKSKEAQFVAVYGRRRVGKTFLVRDVLADKFTFYITGIYKGSKQAQLENFANQIKLYFKKDVKKLESWQDAFVLLRDCIIEAPAGKKVIFFDELPWMDTQRSNFIKALELFWNGWASAREDVMLIVCGSATSWMENKLIHAKGGLHNRLTQRLHLKQFSLREVREYIRSRGMEWSEYEIAECYMVLGGIPYYLSKLLPELSMSENIDNLFFAASPALEKEFEMLYRALFDNPERYVRIVELLGSKQDGLTREEIGSALGDRQGGTLTKVLKDLEVSGIITAYPTFGYRKKKLVYNLTDFYTAFYLSFVKNNRGRDHHFWTNMSDNPKRWNWQGHAFERLCQYHTDEIKQKMGILGILTEISTWRGKGAKPYQIDMVIDRRDNNISLCEMKFSVTEHVISEQEEKRLRERMQEFKLTTGTRKTISWTFITSYGVKRNRHSHLVRNQVCLEDLFERIR